MKRRTILIGTFLLATLFLFAVSSLTPPPNRKITGHFLALTNGTIGPMTAQYSRFSTNHATIIRDWSSKRANAALVRVTNNQSCAIWLFPFCNVKAQSPQRSQPALVLNAADFNGIWLPSGAATNVEVAVFVRQEHPWRVELGYTRSREYSFIQNLQRLPRDLLLFLTRQQQMVVEQTIPISTDWIRPQ